MEHPYFTEQDRQRLAQLQRTADQMLEDALKDPRFRRWEQLLQVVGSCAFISIFFVSHERGVVGWIDILFFILTIGAFALLLFLIRWKSQIQDRVEEEFFKKHGVEYKQLREQEDIARRTHRP